MLRFFAIVVAVVSLNYPISANASCSLFEPYDSGGNYKDDLHFRIDAALKCERWDIAFDQNRLQHAQNHMVQNLLSQNGPADAADLAKLYFADAVRRFEDAAKDPDRLDILSDNGTHYVYMGSHFEQMGMLVVDIESTFLGCSDIDTVDTLASYVRLRVQDRLAKFIEDSETARLLLMQRLEDYQLEDWQKYFPDATSMEDIRNDPQIIAALNPDPQAKHYSEIDRRFYSIFRTSYRIDEGKAELCLLDAFTTYADVAELPLEQRKIHFPQVYKYVEREFSVD